MAPPNENGAMCLSWLRAGLGLPGVVLLTRRVGAGWCCGLPGCGLVDEFGG